MGCAMGSINLGNPGVDRHLFDPVLDLSASHIILSYNELYTPSFTPVDLTLSFQDSVWVHAIPWIHTAG